MTTWSAQQATYAVALQQPLRSLRPNMPVSCLPAEQQQAHKYRKRIKVNWLGCTIMFIYLVALIFYIWVRVTKTLGLGKYTW